MIKSKVKMSKGVFFIYFALGVIVRIIPHPPDFTPMIAICMFSGLKTKKMSVIFIFILMLSSDVFLSLIKGYPVFGWWSFFTYTGFIAIILISAKFKFYALTKKSPIVIVLIFSFAFWTWSNFGVWLAGGIYPKNFKGLIDCYIMALPFLRNALVGNVMWLVIVYFLPFKVKKRFSILEIKELKA